MQIPGRTFIASNNSYFYGFNGKEIDKDISTQDYDYGMRIYDARIGRFLSVDPLVKKFPWYTPYQFTGNKPIWAMDLDGQEDRYYTVNIIRNGLGQVELLNITEDESKAVLFYNLNPLGRLGRGNLFKLQIQAQDLDGKPISLVTTYVFQQKAAKYWDKVKSATREGGILFSSSLPGAGSENQYEPSALHPDPNIVNIDGLVAAGASFKDIPGVEGFPSLLGTTEDLNKILGNGNKIIAMLLKVANSAENINSSKEIFMQAKEIVGDKNSNSTDITPSTVISRIIEKGPSPYGWTEYVKDSNGNLVFKQFQSGEPDSLVQGKNGAPDTLIQVKYSEPKAPRKIIKPKQ